MTRFRPLLALLVAALTLIAPATLAQKPEADIDQQVEQLEATVADYEQYAGNPGGERILSYVSDVDVVADGTLNVTETITVNALGSEIRRGIYRDFPTIYDHGGRRVRVGFDVHGVERDGRPEPYTVENIRDGRRVWIGRENTFIERGRHIYVIRYTTTRQLGFFEGYDELYWNVTGNFWRFPIDRAEVRIRLPQAVPFGAERVFGTGAYGSRERNAEVVSERPGEIVIRTTAPLGAREGLTVAVRWQKGVVAAPPPPSRARLWFQDYAPPIAAFLALFGLGFFYYYAWKKAGRGPVPGTVVPLFEPPEGLSAAAIRYIRRMAFDNRCFAAAIVDGGVHRKLRMEESEKGLFRKAKVTLIKTGEPDGLPEPERRMLTALFAGGDSLEMDKANHSYFGAARKALQENLEEAYLGRLFLKNLGWAWVGMMFLLAALLFVGMTIALSDIYAGLGERAMPALGFLLMIGAVIAGVNSRAARKDGSWARAALAGLLGLGGSALVVFAFIQAVQVEPFRVWVWMLVPLLILPVALSAFVWMAAPTPEGRALMDKIAGFERYLSITDENRLEVLHPPEKTPELFERYLPHAIALGVENRWASKFAAVLAAAAADPSRQDGSTMGWYVGSSNAWSNPGMFASTVGASLASSVASAATAPGSSSGSGGGGFSGGGGGGGGGGGW
ncbi:MAG TPA: DUF2207 domain-containing protein [Allosphingosinicella sp.]|jgi:uncharacterized membrane protein YgcG|nr:DUF2207 domain-containing protein [Allosphingosinicella sp.]